MSSPIRLLEDVDFPRCCKARSWRVEGSRQSAWGGGGISEERGREVGKKGGRVNVGKGEMRQEVRKSDEVSLSGWGIKESVPLFSRIEGSGLFYTPH